MVFEFLGTGTSHGVPVIGCSCPVCRSGDPLDRRYRCSLLVRSGSAAVLVDCGPEFRLQALRADGGRGIARLDALLLTHAHADHLHGLDDVRPLSRAAPLPIYGHAECLAELRERFAYIFKDTQRGGGKPRLELRPAEGRLDFGGLTVEAVTLKHGRLDVLGWIFAADGRRAAYLTDVSAVPEAVLGRLEDLDLLALGALRDRPHETHFSFGEAFSLIERLRPRRAFLTHLCHDHSHSEIAARCAARFPAAADGVLSVAPAYDGLTADPAS
jgi:phosphoribosyl 1,2-cyclic phosphate phosphodiesterase